MRTKDIPSGRRHLRTRCSHCRRAMAATSARFPGAAFQASAVLQTFWLVALAPRPEGRGYRKVRLSGELCLSGENRSPDTGHLGDSAKDFCLSKSFATAPFFAFISRLKGALDIETTDVNQGYASLSHADGRSRRMRRHDAFATPLFCELQEADLVAVRRITMRRTPHDEFVRADAPHRHIRAETVACRYAQQLQRNGPFARP